MNSEHPDVNPYLHPARLPELLGMVQVLAHGRSASRGEGGLRTAMGAEPASAASWTDLARAHPELFRVGGGREPSVALIARHAAGSGEGGSRTPLDDAILGRLMTMTMELHDHARSRADSAARELRRTEERIAEGEQRRRERESEYALRLSEERRLRETTRTAV
ncbi:MAG: hypothetical protein PVG82_03740, partial [Chromatiales bacterium]